MTNYITLSPLLCQYFHPRTVAYTYIFVFTVAFLIVILNTAVCRYATVSDCICGLCRLHHVVLVRNVRIQLLMIPGGILTSAALTVSFHIAGNYLLFSISVL